MPTNVFDYILAEVNRYKTERIPIADNWDWNMYEHVHRTIVVKHGKFSKGPNDDSRPSKNIVLPILNVAYRTEGFDVKDITPFVDDEKNYYKSFFVKKFHPRWARQNDVDTFIDEFSESVIDFGLGLAKNVNSKRPEAVPLQRVAFCDQRDVLAGPICEVHPYTVSELLEMKGKWDDDRIEEAMTLFRDEATRCSKDHIEVYELHGKLPENWLDGDEHENSDDYVGQVHIVTFYKLANGDKQGICLFKGPERRSIYKAHKRTAFYGRACGFGGVEELFDPQVWINYSEIQLKEMLDAASLMLLKTTDPQFETKNKLSDYEKGEILVLGPGNDIGQVVFQPFNKEAFDRNVDRWEQHAMTMGSASDGALGKNPSAGTPFALQNLIVQEGNGTHDYRRGKLAYFIGTKVYPDWILPSMVRDMLQGQKWLEELSVDEVQEVVEDVVENLASDHKKKKLMEGVILTEEEQMMFREVTKAQFLKGGSRRFLEILKDELKDIPIDVEVNVAGKQEYLGERADKLTNIFREVFKNPAVLQVPGMGKLFNEIIESSGFSPLNFTALTKGPVPEEPEAPAPTAVPSPVALKTSA